jgi:hypothetical protein
VNANWLILDYVAVCESRAEILAFDDFIPLWIAAHEIAEDAALPLLGEWRHSQRRVPDMYLIGGSEEVGEE